jgi:D-mannonate dehydratase
VLAIFCPTVVTTTTAKDRYRFGVRKRQDLLEVVIPFFKKYPLRTAKQSDFEEFATCVELIAEGRHLTSAGLIDIVSIMQTMNRQKPRGDVIRILRDHTSDIRDRG